MRNFIYTIILSYLSIGAKAQETGGVEGKIYSKDKSPLTGVTLTLKEIDKSTLSNSIGFFRFSNIVEGNYTISASYLGQILASKSFSISAKESVKLDIEVTETTGELTEVLIVAHRGMNEKILSIGKSQIAGRDLPQLTQTIERSILDRQQALRISDVLQNASGVYVMGNTGGYQEEIASRGYAFGSSNTFKNGARFNNGVTPELSGVEKIEFLKGGSAILYGNVSPGGLMNIVTKKPKFEQGGEISFRTGSYDFYKPSIDIYGSLANSKTIAYRINSSYEKSRSFRDQVSGERVYFNPSLLIKTSPKSEILLEGDYLRDNRNADFGIGSINYTIPDVNRSSFIGVDWGYNKATQTTATATFTHHFSDKWQARLMYSYQNYQQDLFSAARANTNGQMVSANGTWVRGLQKSASIENYNVAEININGNFRTWNVKHQLTFGADNDRYETEATAFNTTLYNNNLGNSSLKNKNIYDTINIFSPTQNRHDIPDLTVARVTTTPIIRYGFYAQDLISLTDQFKVLAGLRYSSQENRTSTVDTAGKSRGYIAGYISNALSPKIGLVYQPMKYMSIFASYTNNFSPNNGTDINSVPLKPSIIDQYELGMKNDLWRGLVSVNFTGYIIINDNFAQAVVPAPPSNPSARELAGEVTSKGLEIDVMTKPIHGFSFIAGYSYNDSRYTESNVYKENDRLRYNPANTANASLYYQFNESSVFSRINLGLGAYYVGERVAGRNTTPTNPTYSLMEVPDYALLDFSMGYQYNRLSVRVKLSNLMNVLSYNIHDDNSVNPIAPRQFSLSIAQKF